MIPHLHEHRNQLLGGRPADQRYAQDSSLTLPALPPGEQTSKEPSAKERRTSPESFFGDTVAEVALPALDLNFKQLEQLHIRTYKPILDVGASYSTVAIEGTFRHVPIHGTDLKYNTTRFGLLKGMESRVSKLARYYREAAARSAGFECYSIPETAWEDCVQQGLKLVDSRMVECRASKILLPDGKEAPNRSFSTVLSHHAVPKYSLREEFLTKELPELLRVTDDRLHLFPLLTAGPGDCLIHIPGSEGRRELERVAREAGFSLEVKVSPTCLGGPPKEPGFDMLGIFVRRRSSR